MSENRTRWEARKVVLVAILILASLYIAIEMRFISVPISATNYAECILENLKYAKTNDGIFVLEEACKKKFPKEK